jgi:2-keto-3-deoxy-L-rhamnonate aldolase RhmA
MPMFLDLLRSSERPTRGIFMLNQCPMMREALATCGLDFVVIDAEAAPYERRDVLLALQAFKASSTQVMVRVKNKEFTEIEQILDLGVECIIAPKVNSRAQAEQLVSASFFPPTGRRGLNPVRASNYFDDVPGYVASANDRIVLLAQIETEEGLTNCADIVAVQGIAGVFVGTGDLSLSLGVPTQIHHPRVVKALASIRRACTDAGKPCGGFASSDETRGVLEDELGYDFVAVGNDVLWLKRSVASVAAPNGQK